jgi:hypothetical protein
MNSLTMARMTRAKLSSARGTSPPDTRVPAQCERCFNQQELHARGREAPARASGLTPSK